MTRKFLWLYVVLLALAGVLAWQLRVRWLNAHAKEREFLARQIAARKALAPAIPTPPQATAPAEYLDVAQQTLFSKDRNPNVVVEPPKPAPEPPMPALPHYHGQMAFGDPVALLSLNNGTQKSYHAGEVVGDFKLDSFNRETIAFEWHGKKVERKLEELVAKNVAPPAPAAAQSQNNAVQTQNAAPEVRSTGPVTTIIAPQPGSSTSNSLSAGGNLPASIGGEIGGGMRACVPTDDSASGTVLSGFRKNVIKSMFGDVCRWEPAK